MRRILYLAASAAALATVLVACNKEQDAPLAPASGNHIIRVAIPETLTKVSMTDETAAGGGMALAWKEGDAIRVTSGSNSELYSIQEGFSGHDATFAGNPVEGTEFDIIYPGSFETKEALGAFSYLNQRQTGNGSTAHLGYQAFLSGVDSYDDIAFTSEWADYHGGTLRQNGVLKLQVTLPSAVGKVLKASLTAPSDIFYVDNMGADKSSELAVYFKNTDVSEANHVLTAYMNISAMDMPIASGTGLKVTVTDEYGNEFEKMFTLAKDVVLQGGKLNTIKVTGEGEPQVFATDYYVSVEGSGAKTGLDPDNALDVYLLKAWLSTIVVSNPEDQMCSDVQAAMLDGVTFHFADGTYALSDENNPDGLKIEYQGYSKQVAFTLKGGPDAILSGGGLYRVFTFGNQTDITIDGMTIANGYREAEGGGILVAAGSSGNATLNLKNVTFKNNKTTTSTSGGAIRVAKGTLNAEGCTFEADNYARNGGSIYTNNDAAVVNCTGCTFKSHSSNTGGAANNSKGTQHYENCTFLGCYTEGGNGGAIHANAAKSIVTVDGCTFKSCKAMTNNPMSSSTSKSGGIISVQQSEFTINNCVFEDCEAVSGALICLQAGNGSTAGTGGWFKCNNTKFLNNRGADRGLIQCNGSKGNKQGAMGFFNNCVFYGNTMRTNQWGFILHGGNPGIACFNNCTIYGNERQQAGGNGVMLNTDGLIIFTNSTLIGAADLVSIRANDASNNARVLLANSIVVNTSATSMLAFGPSNTLKCPTFAYNNIVGPSVDQTGLTLTACDNIFDATPATLDGGTYDETNNVYTWNGPADSFVKMTPAGFETAVKNSLDVKFNTFNAYIGDKSLGDFYYGWLSEIGAVGKDALGHDRGSAWWPGAYQSN